MKKYISFSLLILTVSLLMMSFKISDFYSSMTKADYQKGSKTMKFTTKLNADHIAEALKINKNAVGFEAEVKKYVNNNFDFQVNGRSANLTFTGSQITGKSVWVYFEAKGVQDISSIKIKNTILLSVYPKQTNVVNISYNGTQKTMTFQRGREINEVSF